MESSVEMSIIPFGTTDRSTVEKTEHRGETGGVRRRSRHFGGIRMSMIESTRAYPVDH